MRLMIMSLLICLNLSCTTNPYRDKVIAQQEIVEDTIKEDKIIGGDIPSWTRKSGIEGGVVYAVGQAEFSADRSPFYVENAAVMDAEMRLYSDAPTDVRIITQNALTGAGIDSSEFYQIQTKLQEIVGITGVRRIHDKTACRKIIRYGELSTRVTRACWVQVAIPVRELIKAYERTLAMKFGEYKANEFKQLMKEELDNIKDNPLTRGLREKKLNKSVNTNIDALDDGGSGQRLPSSKVKQPKGESKIQDSNGKRRNVSRSNKKAEVSNTQRGVPSIPKGKGSPKVNEPQLQQRKEALQKLKSKRRSLVEV